MDREDAAPAEPPPRDSATGEPPAYARIAVGRPVRGPFTYRLPAALAAEIQPGRRVVVPFGRGKAVGFYLGPTDEAPEGAKLRDVVQLLDDAPVFDPELLALLEWTASYYRFPLGETLRSALPPGLNQPHAAPVGRPTVREYVRLLPQAEGAKRQRGVAMNAILDYLATRGEEVDVEELSAAIPNLREPLKRLVERGLVALREEAIVPERPELQLAGVTPPAPTPEQASVLVELEEAVRAQKFAPFLLHGVTGAGKTEVYLRTIAAALEAGHGALVLVPEIGLTPQLVGRFRARFGDRVAVLHSGLKDSERLREWMRLRRGEAPIAVGVRSAIFAPIPSLGVVIVDEEHDSSFKQEEKLRYNARDLAVVRARNAGCPVVLGSATPSLETLFNARKGRYQLLELTQRVDDRPMPEVQLVDMRLHEGQGHTSAAFPQLAAKAKLNASLAAMAAEASPTYGEPAAAAAEEQEPEKSPLLGAELCVALQETLDRRQQAILFLNRRGHSTYHVCVVCGFSLKCTNCAVSLILHQKRNLLMCHYCGVQMPLPERCPECNGPIEGFGMGTERLETELLARFPGMRVSRLDRDSATSAEEVTAILASFARGEKDVLIGTQMVAKGHDFPGVTLVGVILADAALNLPDFRASERTFQLLAQVAGRAGRGKESGRVIVQTFNPEAQAIACVMGHDFRRFAEHELEIRLAFRYPPFSRMVAVRIEGMHPGHTADVAQRLAQVAGREVRRAQGELQLLGPTPAPIARIRGRTRWQLLLKGPTPGSLQRATDALEAAIEQLTGNVRAVIDVDPLSML